MAEKSGSSQQGSGRERGKNWQLCERNELLQLISERRDVLLSRKTDINANFEKARAWEEVSKHFEAKFGRKWTLQQIKEQWKRVRINAKKEYSSYAKESRKTGGGPPPPEPGSITLLVKEMCPYDFVQLQNRFDDDSTQNNGAISALEFLATGRCPSPNCDNPSSSDCLEYGGQDTSRSTSTPFTTSHHVLPATNHRVATESLCTTRANATPTACTSQLPRTPSQTFGSTVTSHPFSRANATPTPCTSSPIPRTLSQPFGSTLTSQLPSSNAEFDDMPPTTPSSKRALEYPQQGTKKCNPQEERMVELVEEEHATSNTEIRGTHQTISKPTPAKRALQHPQQRNKKGRLPSAEEIMVDLAQEEHDLRMKLMEKEHALKEKEHALRMEILELEKKHAEAKLEETKARASQKKD